MINKGVILEEIVLDNILMDNKLASAVVDTMVVEQNVRKTEFLVALEREESKRKEIEGQGIGKRFKEIGKNLDDKVLDYYCIKEFANGNNGYYIAPCPVTRDSSADVNMPVVPMIYNNRINGGKNGRK